MNIKDEMTVREIELRYGKTIGTVDSRKVTSPCEIATLIKAAIADRTQEAFCVLLLDTRHRVIGIVEVSVGTLNASIVHPREVFRAAILSGAAAIIIAHNHPSGDVQPSAEDIEVTDRLRQAGELLGIKALDHIIVSPVSDSIYSFVEEGR